MMGTFNLDNVLDMKMIGSGVYGKIYQGQHESKQIVVKIMDDQVDEEDVIKEASFLRRLSHTNVVKYIGIDQIKNAIMLEYLYFDLKFCGWDKKLSSLDKVLNEISANGFVIVGISLT